MGGRDEYDPTHLRYALEAERLSEELPVVGWAGDVLDGPRANCPPEARSATLGHHLRQDAAKAVSFYKAAFGAVEAYRLDMPNGCACLSLPHYDSTANTFYR